MSGVGVALMCPIIPYKSKVKCRSCLRKVRRRSSRMLKWSTQQLPYDGGWVVKVTMLGWLYQLARTIILQWGIHGNIMTSPTISASIMYENVPILRTILQCWWIPQTPSDTNGIHSYRLMTVTLYVILKVNITYIVFNITLSYVYHAS